MDIERLNKININILNKMDLKIFHIYIYIYINIKLNK